MALLNTVPTPTITYQETTTPSAPAGGDQYTFIDSSDHKLKRINSSSVVTTIEGGGGSGAATYTNAYASPPGTPNAGDLWYPSDGLLAFRYSGSVWVPIHSIYPQFTTPIYGNYTFTNQNSAVAKDYGAIELYSPNASGVKSTYFLKTAPALNYNIDAAIRIIMPTPNYSTAGLCWSDGTAAIHVGLDNAGTLSMYKFTTTSAGDSGSYINIANWMTRVINGLLYIRLHEDSSNRVVSVSIDGRNFWQVHTVGRTDFLTATHVGLIAHHETTDPITLHLLSWKES